MNRHQKKVLSIAAAVANLSFSIAVAGVATLAWFTNTARANSTGISITTSTEHIRLDYVILKYDDNLKQGVATGVNDASEFILPKYDRYITERNEYANLIVRANLVFPKPINTSETEIKIDITKLEQSTLKAIDEGDPNNPEDDTLKIQELTSNVVQFKSIVTQYTLDDGENTVVPIDVGIQEIQGTYQSADDAKYMTAKDYFASRNTPTTFISLMNNQPVDPMNGNVITLVPELYNVGVITGAVVYLECTYNEALVKGFIEDHPNESLSNLTGDIERIDFGIHGFGNETFGAIATGQYIRMTSEGSSYDGQYIDSYIANSSQQILDGSLTVGNEELILDEEEDGTGINVSNNQKSISNYISTNKNKVYASEGIDRSSFTFNRSEGTYKSINGHYVGNPSTVDGITSSSDSAEMKNTLDFDGVDNNYSVIKPLSQDSMRLQYDNENSKFAYYSQSKEKTSLYRYHENDPIEATLTGFSFTAPTGSDATYSLGEYFSLRGIKAVATYTRRNPEGDGNITFTINVADICTYVMEDIELIPEKTSFSFAGTKTVTVTYKDRGETFSDTFDLTIISDTINEMTLTTVPAKKLYRVGELFDISDLVASASFAIAGNVTLLPTEYQCKLSASGTPLYNQSPVNVAGENMEVVVEYTGGAAHAVGYHDPTFTITVVDYILEIISAPEELDVDESATITFRYNANLTWTITGIAGALSFSSSEIVTTHTTTYTGATSIGYPGSTETLTIYGKDDGVVTVTVVVTGKTSITETFDIVVGNPPTQVTFTGGVDVGVADGSSIRQDTLTKNNISMSSNYCYTKAGAYRFYATSTLTISSTVYNIVEIEFTMDGTYPASNLSTETSTYNGQTGIWSGSSDSISFSFSGTTRIASITITYEEIQRYTVTVNPGLGNGDPVVFQVNAGTTYTFQTYSYYEFTAPQDRAFKWWDVGGNHYQPNATLVINADTTITAIWSEIYTVSFDKNGGSGTMADVSVGEGSTYNLPQCTFTAPSGKTFSHWTVGGVVKNVGDPITITGDVTVVANWKNLYTVTLSPGIGDGDDIVSDPIADGGTYTLPSCPQTFIAPSGKMFSHWSVGGVIKNPGETITITSNITVTAQWGDYYTITIDPNTANGGTGTTTTAYVLQNGSYTLPTIASCNFTAQSGYEFSHWQIGNDATPRDPGYVIEHVTASTTITAIWIAQQQTYEATIYMSTSTWNIGSSWTSSTPSPATDTKTDDLGNTWTVTYVFNQYSRTNQPTYIQFGSGTKPATSVTFTTTLSSSHTLKTFEFKGGGFSGTAGTITLKVGNTTVATGSLNASNDVVVSATASDLNAAPGTEITVTITSISKGIKCYYISYSY